MSASIFNIQPFLIAAVYLVVNWLLFAEGTLLDGEPIINLPPKSVELKRVDFSKEERDFYSRLEADSRAQFEV